MTRRGGQSESAAGTSRDLDYALKVTATDVPEYLQCAICHGVVKNAMILPWDPEGRTTCESCIRDALNQSGFRCPLTDQEGVSPDDLLPNAGLKIITERSSPEDSTCLEMDGLFDSGLLSDGGRRIATSNLRQFPAA